MSDEPQIDQLIKKVSFGIKYWLCFEEKNILGKGWANLLRMIDKEEINSLTDAAKVCGYSYKYAWNILKRIEKRTGKTAVITGKGGAGGGGFIKLNNWGEKLLEIFNKLESEILKMRQKIDVEILKIKNQKRD